MGQIEVVASSVVGRPAVVAPPHPLYGGRMDNPVVTTLARALGESGYAPLRFNWRGVGGSAGTPSGRIEDAEADYRAAILEASKASGTPKARVLAAGYSFGAAAALRIAASDGATQLERLDLVALPVQILQSIDVASIEQPIHVVVGDSDQYARVDELTDALSTAREVRVDVIPDADHFFGFPPWLDRLAELVRAGLA